MISDIEVLLVTVALLDHHPGEAFIGERQHQQKKISLEPLTFANRDKGRNVEADRAHAAGAQLALKTRDQ
jgi:hypothetical protein